MKWETSDLTKKWKNPKKQRMLWTDSCFGLVQQYHSKVLQGSLFLSCAC